MNRREDLAQLVTMASMNKCLAQSNKSRTGAKATKKRKPPPRTGVDKGFAAHAGQQREGLGSSRIF